MASNDLKGVNQDSIQSMNRILIIKLLREQRVCFRANLAKLSSLRKATVTYVANDFINWGCVKEVGLMQGDKDRRSISITLAEDNYYVIGIRLARRSFKIGSSSTDGKLIHMKQQQIESGQDPDRAMEYIISNIHAMVGQVEPDKILAIGMTILRPFIGQGGKIAVLTETAEWGNMASKGELEKHFSYLVFMGHDANAGTYAQIWYDKTIDKDSSLIYVAIRQGVNAGIAYHGKTIKGELGIAGETGHTTINYDGPRCECGNRGCLRKYYSSIVLARDTARRRERGEQCDLGQTGEVVEVGDMAAIGEFRTRCCYLGYGLMNVVNSFNPSVIILGDKMSHVNGNIMLEEVDHVLKKWFLPEVYSNLKVKVSKTVRDSVLHGIGAICINGVLGNLELYLVKWICRTKYVWKGYG